jgi:hypothetical protein
MVSTRPGADYVAPGKKRLEEGNRVSKEERKEAEQEKNFKIPKTVWQNGMVQRWWKGYTRSRMLSNILCAKCCDRNDQEEHSNHKYIYIYD